MIPPLIQMVVYINYAFYFFLSNGTICSQYACLTFNGTVGHPYFSTDAIYLPVNNTVVIVDYNLKVKRIINVGKHYEFVIPYKDGLILCLEGCEYLKGGEVVWEADLGWVRWASLGKELIVVTNAKVYSLDPLKGTVISSREIDEQLYGARTCKDNAILFTKYSVYFFDQELKRVVKVYHVNRFGLKISDSEITKDCKRLAVIVKCTKVVILNLENRAIEKVYYNNKPPLKGKGCVVSGVWVGDTLYVGTLSRHLIPLK